MIQNSRGTQCQMVLVFAAEGGIAAVGLQLVVLLGSGKIIPSLRGNQQ